MLTGLSLLFLMGIIFSQVARKIRLPHFLGIIFAGVLVKGFLPESFYAVAPDLKKMALVVLMTRVSFNLKVNELKEIGHKAFFVSVIPPVIEMIGTALVFHFILGFSVVSSLVMGSVLCASSPAISVPLLMKIKNRGYGVKKRIPQMLIASGGVDNAFVIVLFYTLLSFESTGQFDLKGLINIPIAFITGGIAGFLMYYVDIFFIKKLKLKGVLKLIATIATAFFLLGLEDNLGKVIPYSGIIAILVVGATMLYKKEELAHELAISYDSIWAFFEILLFGIVGASIDFGALGQYLVLGVCITLLAMVVRMLGVHLALIHSNLNYKERTFCGISLSAKATVQASLGGIPLAMGLPYGDLILAVSVIAIFITSPTCAILIEKTYKKLLSKDMETVYDIE